MSTEIKVPALGESVTEATIGQWFKQVGDAVVADEPLVELETDKVTLEVPAPAAGILETISAQPGETVNVGALIGAIGEGSGTESRPREDAAPAPEPEPEPAPAPAATGSRDAANGMAPSPSAQKLMAENGLGEADLEGSGRRGQILKEDVLAAMARPPSTQASAAVQTPSAAPAAYPEATPAAEAKPMPEARPVPVPAPRPARAEAAAEPVTSPAPAYTPLPVARGPVAAADEAREERVRMSRLRQTIARRLKDAQNTAAMLTTFNEVDMKPVMDLRAQYKELFEKKHGVKLGFMGFFTRAVTHALKEIPAVNAELDGDELIYKNYAHIGVAVGTEKGLVVPVVRDADRLSIAEIEKDIARLGRLARDGALSMADMQGGTFTISNGGVYGSLMSTPILNAPQSGILGMHKIQDRPVVVGGQIVVRPMIYLALSYDHRVVDGKEAVTFLVRVKESLEAPERLVLDL
jgi:2-oxoglutarate dehydrogenase E2 component (dihydrolipoamide succinyltransferase)